MAWPPHATDEDSGKLQDRQRIQEWLKLRDLPSERFAEGLKTAIGRTVILLGARGRMQGLAIFAGPMIANTIDAAAAAYLKEYVRLAGSVYR